MKKIILLIISAIFSLNGFSQDSVLGIKFGDTYSSVKGALEDRYGEFNVLEDGDGLQVYDINIGAYTFNAGLFDFQYSQGYSYFYYAEFQKNFSVNESSNAKNFREQLRFTLIKKYHFCYQWQNDQGYKCYSFSTIQDNVVNSPDVTLLTRKSKSKGGKYYIYVTLYYGPHYFVDESSDF